MDEKKDITKKVLNGKPQDQGLIRVANYFDVQDQDQYTRLAHRAQKILTALYMVTDFLELGDPLRNMIREESGRATQSLFSLTHATKHERVEKLSKVHNQLYASLSYLSVVYDSGFVSEMNHTVIAHEIVLLCLDIDLQIKKSLPYDRRENNNRSIKEFSFSESFFGDSPIKDSVVKKDTAFVKDTLKDNSVEIKDMSFKKDSEPVLRTEKNNVPKNVPDLTTQDTKNQRQEDILKILKQKKDASINDISLLIKDCSSKTIQRDLATLIKKNLVRKEGDRRWSVYNLNY